MNCYQTFRASLHEISVSNFTSKGEKSSPVKMPGSFVPLLEDPLACEKRVQILNHFVVPLKLI